MTSIENVKQYVLIPFNERNQQLDFLSEGIWSWEKNNLSHTDIKGRVCLSESPHMRL